MDALIDVSDWSSKPSAWRAGSVATIGVACSFATGIVHAGILFVTRHALHQLVWYSREFLWMAPLAYFLWRCRVCSSLLPRQSSHAIAQSTG